MRTGGSRSRLLRGALAAAAAVTTAPAAVAAIRLTLHFTSVTTVTITHATRPTGKVHEGNRIDCKDLLFNAIGQFGKKKGQPAR